MNRMKTLKAGLFVIAFVCLGAGSGLAQSTPVTCFEVGHAQTALDNSQIARLCCHQNSAAPINCYQSSHQSSSLSDEDLIGLCACANNNNAVRCYNKANAETSLSTQESLAMCGEVSGAPFPSYTGVIPLMTPGPWQPAR
jgi:hypothetical protein